MQELKAVDVSSVKLYFIFLYNAYYIYEHSYTALFFCKYFGNTVMLY